MSSNMIKAYSIAYDREKTRVLDMSDKEDMLSERLQEILPFRPFLESEPEETKESDFIQGLPVQDLGDVQFLEEEAPKQELSEQDIEEIKNSLREEIMAEMSPILQRKGDDIIANARAQAEGLLDSAKKDAEIAKESILKMASAQGYEEGLKRAKIEEERTLHELESRRNELEQSYAQKIAELEPAYAGLLIELVKKVTGVSYEHHKEVLLYLLDTGMEFAQKDKQFDVLLCEEDYKKYAALFPKIQERYKDKFTLEFKKDASLSEGDCRLENENRVIDCGLGIRLNSLLEELALLG